MKCTLHGVKDCTAAQCIKERLNAEQKKNAIEKATNGEYKK